MNKFTKSYRQKKIAPPPLPRFEVSASSSSLQRSAAAFAMADGRDGREYLDADYGGEDKEVKMNLRFCDNSFHDPLIHFDFKQFTPDVSDTMLKAQTRQQNSSGDTLARLWGSAQMKKNTRTVTSTSMDSIMNAVFTAFDYDIEGSIRTHSPQNPKRT